MSNNIETVRTIGRGVRVLEESVSAVIMSLPADFDASKRGAVADAVHAWACGEAERPAVKTGPKGNQTTTDYGRGHDTLTKAVKRELGSGDKPITLRATLSGEGGGSVTIPTDHALYAVLTAMIREGQAEAAAA